MKDKTRDELLVAMAAGIETLVALGNSEDAKESDMRLLKCIWRAQKENFNEEAI